MPAAIRKSGILADVELELPARHGLFRVDVVYMVALHAGFLPPEQDLIPADPDLESCPTHTLDTC